MSYTITTVIRGNGDDRMFAQVMGGGEDLLALWKEHTDAVQIELIRRGCDGSIVLKPTEKHPLEDAIFDITEWLCYVGSMQQEPVQCVDDAFSKCLNADSTDRLEKRHWIRVAVGWAAIRLVKMGFYKTLPEVLQAAVEQATKGKGQRHGGDRTPFLEQPWVRLYKTHGLGFLLGQADKKYHEALGKENQEDQTREILGAIVYLGMALLVLEGRVA